MKTSAKLAERQQADQVVWIYVAVHADVWASRCQIANDAARARPEVLEGVLCIDSAFDCVTLCNRCQAIIPRSMFWASWASSCQIMGRQAPGMMTNSIQKVTLPDTYLDFDILLLPAQHFPLGSSNLLLNKV